MPLRPESTPDNAEPVDAASSLRQPNEKSKDSEQQELLLSIPRKGGLLRIYRSAWSGVRAIQYNE